MSKAIRGFGKFRIRDRNVENSIRYFYLYTIETWKTRFDIFICTRSKRGKLDSIFLFVYDRNVENSIRYFYLHAIETWKTRFDIEIFLFSRDRNVENSNQY